MTVDPHWLDDALRRALAEDVGAGDHTTLATIPAGQHGQARALVKAEGVIAGVQVAEALFRILQADIAFEVHKTDGERVHPGDVAFAVSGDVHTLLQGERVMLNLVQRMSGIATATRQLADRLEGTGCQILDTRKTVPLLRPLDKWAVRIGGGTNHRIGLYDMILIKDNHTDAAGGVRQALEAAARYLRDKGLSLPVVVETRTLDEVRQACETGGMTRILLDNMNTDQLRAAVELIAGRFPTEASGNIGPHNVRQIAETGVNFVSLGGLTHSVKALDVSFKIV